MEAHDAAVERLVPHRGGMLWIDRVLHCDADGVVAEATEGLDEAEREQLAALVERVRANLSRRICQKENA